MQWTVSQTVKLTGIPADTLRYYDKQGLVSPKRHVNGYRVYDENDIANLKTLIVMKYAHFSLSEIYKMEQLLTSQPDANCNEISRGILESKITELNQAIRNYQKIVAMMENLLDMIDCVGTVTVNKEQVDGYINQIFDDIRDGSIFGVAGTLQINMSEEQ